MHIINQIIKFSVMRCNVKEGGNVFIMDFISRELLIQTQTLKLIRKSFSGEVLCGSAYFLFQSQK